MTITKDEWTPTLDGIERGTGKRQRKRFFGDLGARIVFAIKRDMQLQRSFADHTPYAPLKITHRYEGSKDLIANRRNLKRAKFDARLGRERIGGVFTDTVAISRRVPVAPGTILFHTGALHNRWGIRDRSASSVTVGSVTPFEGEKAYYNDDRGGWDWGERSAAELMERVGGYMDGWLDI